MNLMIIIKTPSINDAIAIIDKSFHIRKSMASSIAMTNILHLGKPSYFSGDMASVLVIIVLA